MKQEFNFSIIKEMVVIYTADVIQAEEVYDLGGLCLIIEAAYLVKRDSDEIYARLKRKIETGQRLTEEELMELMILPLTVEGKTEGEYIKLICQIRKKIAKNISAEASADMLEEDLQDFLMNVIGSLDFMLFGS